MNQAGSSQRVTVDGKFLRLGAEKFHIKGVTYGPFAPDAAGCTFASLDRTALDFKQVRQLGANTIRVYYVPPEWLLDLAHEHGLKVMVDVPWEKHRCFLETCEMREEAKRSVRNAAAACARHPAVLALSVVNEIPPEIVRWHGAHAVAAFIDELVAEVKSIDPHVLCTFASFPPTEFLQPSAIDFVTFNVYLHDRYSFEAYLDRLQTIANEKPLVLGEFGMDGLREGEEVKARLLGSQIEAAFRRSLAGTVIFSFTDDWYRGGEQISGWEFGLTTRERHCKPSYNAVRSVYKVAPYFPLPRSPRVSVIVASYNGASTLRTCLESLARINYPDYDVILVDDGSTDQTPQIAAEFPSVRNIRQPNLGLSAARNTGIAAATGEIVAFTDSDCRADEDWLRYLVSDLLSSDFVGIGGHNFLPPEDSPTAAAVLASPGGPAHVLLTDREAEHIPGCNMAFYKAALDRIDGFDSIFRKAGDDVDVCWRLQQAGGRIGFSHGGFVWHYRRSTVKAYLKQQAGYGEAEALLAQKHPEYFNALGGGVWRGRIYAQSTGGIVVQRSVIYHGIFGSGFFQKLYSRQPSFALMVSTSLQFHCFVTLPLIVVSAWWEDLWPAALAALALSVGVCIVAGAQAVLPADRQRWWSRPLVALLFFLQPLVRGSARYKSALGGRSGKTVQRAKAASKHARDAIAYWAKPGFDRVAFLHRVQHHLESQGWEFRVDSGWDEFDLETQMSNWTRVQLATAQEDLAHGRRFLRCRIVPKRTWGANVLLVTAIVACAALIGTFREREPLIWFVLSVVPFATFFVDSAQRREQAALAAVVQQASDELGLEEFVASNADKREPSVSPPALLASEEA